MAVTRRGFIQQTVALGSMAFTYWIEVDEAWAQADCTLPPPAAAQQFVPSEPRVVERLSAGQMGLPANATKLAQLRAGFGAVQQLSATNPGDLIGWTKQIAQHCLNCASTNPNNIHFNWQFLPWHRGLLYFLERIMRKQTGQDDLRLVYWDWENPSSRVLPAIYVPNNQPLFWGNRSFPSSKWPLRDADVNVQPALGTPTFDDFGGTSQIGNPVPVTFTGPHADVHNNFAPGDMADLRFSPRDPVFYAHHSNIDRLWSSWVAAGHANPDFGKARVFFYDENRTWRFVLMNDLRDESKLGYKYSTLMQPQVPIGRLTRFSAERTPKGLTIGRESMSALRTRPSGPRFLYLRNIQSLDKLPPQTLRYGIFAGDVAPGTVAEKASAFVGRFSRVSSQDHDHVAALSAAIEVTGRMNVLLERELSTLRVVALDDADRTTAASIALQAENLTIVG